MAQEAYNDAHRSALKALVQEIVIEEKELFELVKTAYKEMRTTCKLGSERDLDIFFHKVNEKLVDFSMKMEVKKRPGIDGKIYWVLVNRESDDISLAFSHGLSEKDCLVVKDILTSLVKSKSGNISFKDIKKLVRQSTLGEGLFDQLKEHKWLVEDDGAAQLWTGGMRMLVELETDLRNLGAHICKIRKVPVLKTNAYKKWYKESTNSDFVDSDKDDDVEESQMVETQGGELSDGTEPDNTQSQPKGRGRKAATKAKSSSSKSKATSSRRGRSAREEEDIDDDDDDEPATQVALSRSERSQRRTTQKSKAYNEETDDENEHGTSAGKKRTKSRVARGKKSNGKRKVSSHRLDEDEEDEEEEEEEEEELPTQVNHDTEESVSYSSDESTTAKRRRKN